MDNRKTIFIMFLTIIFISSVGLSYSYFSNTIGQKDVKDQVVQTGTLELTYTDSPQIIMNNIKPGNTLTKNITVKNTGTLDTAYNLVWQELTNEITRNEMIISAACERLNSNNQVEGTCEGIDEKAINLKIIKRNISIESGITHKYTITITFKEANTSQNYNQGKSFNGVLGIEEYKDNSPEPIYCTYDGELTQGAEYVNGQYTYHYMQEGFHDGTNRGSFGWQNIETEGWGVRVNVGDEDITSKLCTYINNKPIVSTSLMIYGQNIKSIDLSSYNTKNIINMSSMFEEKNTSNTYELDLSNFDTSNVTSMNGMFYNSQATTLDVSNFDTSNVTNMRAMFHGCKTPIINVSSFNTSSVTDMSYMFSGSKATSLDLSNFDTSNVTNMKQMFDYTSVTSLNLSNFNTSNVTDMSNMFYNSSATLIDLNSFNTSKVTNMSAMFDSCPNLTTIYVGNKFITNAVVFDNSMFSNSSNLVGGAGTVYDANHVDKEYARVDGGTALPGYFTLKTN